MEDKGISLNKFISSTGITSRRQADQWIESGRVKINKVIARKGNRVFENDEVTIDDQPLKAKPKLIYLALNKPPGITCTTDLKDPSNIIDFLNYPERIFPIGRLDKASTGLILLTNDGDIVNKILREENNHQKEYIVKVDRAISKSFLAKMASGVPILGTNTKRCEIELLSPQVFKIVLTQGLNRQIRRMCEFLDYRVVSLKRIRIMNIHLKDLKVEKWRHLDAQELNTLKKTLNH